MINNWFWKSKKAKSVESVDREFLKMKKRYQLKERTLNAIKYETNWEVRLMNFMEKNQNNQNLIVKVAEYRSYLMRDGCDREEAAKECLEMYQH
jgi:hypothetical protein